MNIFLVKILNSNQFKTTLLTNNQLTTPRNNIMQQHLFSPCPPNNRICPALPPKRYRGHISHRLPVATLFAPTPASSFVRRDLQHHHRCGELHHRESTCSWGFVLVPSPSSGCCCSTESGQTATRVVTVFVAVFSALSLIVDRLRSARRQSRDHREE